MKIDNSPYYKIRDSETFKDLHFNTIQMYNKIFLINSKIEKIKSKLKIIEKLLKESEIHMKEVKYRERSE